MESPSLICKQVNETSRTNQTLLESATKLSSLQEEHVKLERENYTLSAALNEAMV